VSDEDYAFLRGYQWHYHKGLICAKFVERIGLRSFVVIIPMQSLLRVYHQGKADKAAGASTICHELEQWQATQQS
jgi:hypothetical protein